MPGAEKIAEAERDELKIVVIHALHALDVNALNIKPETRGYTIIFIRLISGLNHQNRYPG